MIFFRSLASKFVVYMGDADNLDSQLPQDVHETHGIRTARYPHNHAGSGREHVVTGNGRGYLFQHAPIMSALLNPYSAP